MGGHMSNPTRWLSIGRRLLEQRLYDRISETASPLIVVGMHRSGTTLLVRLLEHCGVFMGINQSGNGEARFFQNLNREALDVLGCNWRCIDYLPETSKLRNHYQWLRMMIVNRLERGLVAEYWGRRNTLYYLTKSSMSPLQKAAL